VVTYVIAIFLNKREAWIPHRHHYRPTLGASYKMTTTCECSDISKTSWRCLCQLQNMALPKAREEIRRWKL